MSDITRHVVITGLDIPFWRLAVFFLKAALAALPTIIVLIGILEGIALAVQLIFGSSLLL